MTQNFVHILHRTPALRPRMSLFACISLATAIGFPDAHGQTTQAGPNDAIGVIIQNVSASEIDSSIRALQGFGTRHWSNVNRDSIARWVRAKFVAAGVTDVVIDSFQYSTTWQRNVIATIPGSDGTGEEILFGAHTDATTSTPSNVPGADDNASGVAAILEIARAVKMSGYRPAKTFRFVGFGAEEVGLVGSATYATAAKNRGDRIVAMINFDMIGHRNAAKVAREFVVVLYPAWRWLASLDSSMARRYTTLVPLMTTSYSSQSDSYPFAQNPNGYPAVFNFDGATSSAYHTIHDIIDSLDMSYAADIVRTGFATALSVDGVATGVVAGGPALPQSFALAQNFPNPFNPSTAIGYDVAAAGPVSLRIYDMLGREVGVVAEGVHPAGHYERIWDARAVASGVYLYRLQWDGGSMTRRMVLLR